MKFSRLLWTVLIASAFLSRGYAQVSSGSLEGRVLDPSNAAIVGASITAIAEGRSVGPSTTSDEAGSFSLVLEAGKYTITITAKDFLRASEAIEIGNGTQKREFLLHLPELRQTVEVTQALGYQVAAINTATKTLTPLRDVPQSITVVTAELMRDQGMMGVADVVRYVPGITVHQGENNRDDLVIRGNRSSADFFLNGVRDDVQYYRDLYNLDRVEALKGPNAMIFGRGGGGGHDQAAPA